MKTNIYNYEWQMERYGLSEEDAKKKVAEYKNRKHSTVEWQMKRYDMTREEAETKLKERFRKSVIKQKETKSKKK